MHFRIGALARKALVAAVLSTLAAPAIGANAAWVHQPVRVQIGGDKVAAITGRTRTLDGCLYVQLDRPAAGGITLVRMDQVISLQVLDGAAWVARAVKPLLLKEPAHCSAEANG